MNVAIDEALHNSVGPAYIDRELQGVCAEFNRIMALMKQRRFEEGLPETNFLLFATKPHTGTSSRNCR